ncbi:MAG: MFS transporter [Anaerolineae bacterium]|nr:MFS transporter [Anaerolineae bacterium]
MIPQIHSAAIRQSRFVNRSPIFYGWIIMFVGTLGLIMTSPGQTYSISVFVEYFIGDLGLSRSSVSTIYTVSTLIGSFALPVVGGQIDRRGVRLMMTVIVVLFGLACIYMGFVLNALMLALGFVAIRMLGQGSLTLVSQNAINQWWVRRRGTMMGISGMMLSLLGLGTFPNLINRLIPLYGWQGTYMLLGLLLLAVMAPLAFILIRNRPEQYGLEPDGHKTSAADQTKAPADPIEENWTLSEAMHAPMFWTLTLSIGLIAMLGTGLIFHAVSIFNDNGFSATVAATVFVPLSLTTATVNITSGVLADRLPLRLLLAVALVFLTLSLLLVQSLQNIWLTYLYGVLLGTTFGLMHIVNSVSWAKYFGRQYLGSITGVTTTVMIAGSALGPMPLGIARDQMGSYNVILSIFAVLPLILAVVSLSSGQPRKRDDVPDLS